MISCLWLGFYFRRGRGPTYGDLVETVQHADLDVLGPSLHDFKETLDGQLDGLGTCHIILVVLLQELSDRLGRPANGIRLNRRRS